MSHHEIHHDVPRKGMDIHEVAEDETEERHRTRLHPLTWLAGLRDAVASRLPHRHRHWYRPIAVHHSQQPFGVVITRIVLLCAYREDLVCGRADQYAQEILTGRFELDDICPPGHALRSLASLKREHGALTVYDDEASEVLRRRAHP